MFSPEEISAPQLKSTLQELGRTVQKQLAMLSEQPVVIAFSDTAPQLQALPACFEHAQQLLQHKIYYHKDLPYTYSEMLENEMRMSYDRQKLLADQIKLGKVEEASALLENYLTILHSNPNATIDKEREIGIELAGVIHSAVSEKDRSLPAPYSDKAAMEHAIRAAETVHDIAECLMGYASAAAGLMLEEKQTRKDARVQEILDWIENNYSSDISLTEIAERMGLSTTYASKQIKAYTGMSVVNYINRIRIDHAKELLETTRLSSNEIGQKVGFRYAQSFIRSFQKLENMTPGNYRSLHHGEKPAGESTEDGENA